MQNNSKRFSRLPAILPLFAGLVLVCGCQSMTASDPPLGPGSVTTADLSAFMPAAEGVKFEGTMQCLNIPSREGSYNSWVLCPAGPYVGAELDVRQCPQDVDTLDAREVIVQGRLIERRYEHLPIIVVDRVIPIKGPPAPLLADRRLAREADEITGQCDPIVAFQSTPGERRETFALGE